MFHGSFVWFLDYSILCFYPYQSIILFFSSICKRSYFLCSSFSSCIILKWKVGSCILEVMIASVPYPREKGLATCSSCGHSLFPTRSWLIHQNTFPLLPPVAFVIYLYESFLKIFIDCWLVAYKGWSTTILFPPLD